MRAAAGLGRRHAPVPERRPGGVARHSVRRARIVTLTSEAPTVPSDAQLAEVALTRDEFASVVQQLHRQPNSVELGILGALWSEHCSYKTSRPLLRALPTAGPRVLQGPVRTRAPWTSATDSRVSSRSSRTTIRAPSSRIKVRPPGWAASCA